MSFCKVFAQTLTNERKKQDFFLNPQILKIVCSQSHSISIFLTLFFSSTAFYNGQ
jgi:hypothetical protein